MEQLLFILSVVIIAYALVSALVPRTVLTAPFLFVGCGALLSQFGGKLIEGDSGHVLEIVAELTLVILLFTDASRINARTLVKEPGLPVRLLGIGLPLTMLLGAIIAKWLFPNFSWAETALLSAILAPTDAALGQAVVSSEQVPARIRQALNVESGLNDGIAVPVVMLFASLAAVTTEATNASHWIRFVLMQVTLGPIVGIAVGLIGGRLLEAAAKREWVTESFMQLSGIALAVLAWAGAIEIGGNGFIAAFVCGMTLGASTMIVKPAIQEFGETEGQMMSLAAFFLFGGLFVVPAMQSAAPKDWAYAVLSLTVIRMLPVALSLIGTKVEISTTIFLGWFGPRGLASLIFALLVSRKHEFAHDEQLFTVAMLTATLSIVAHGISSVPGANWYARVVNAHTCQPGCEHEPVAEFPLRHRHQHMEMPEDK